MKTVKNTKPKTSKTIAEPTVINPAKNKPVTTSAAAKATVTPHRKITSEIIAARAYTIWEAKGHPQGAEMENWLQAESQIKQELQSFPA